MLWLAPARRGQSVRLSSSLCALAGRPETGGSGAACRASTGGCSIGLASREPGESARRVQAWAEKSASPAIDRRAVASRSGPSWDEQARDRSASRGGEAIDVNAWQGRSIRRAFARRGRISRASHYWPGAFRKVAQHWVRSWKPGKSYAPGVALAGRASRSGVSVAVRSLASRAGLALLVLASRTG